MDTEQIEPVLEAVELKKDFGQKKILTGINLQVLPGQCLGIFGLRDTGKTTLLHMLAGLEKVSAGTVKVMGADISKKDSYKNDLGLVTQTKSLFRDLNTEENLEFIACLKSVKTDMIKMLIDKFELQDQLRIPVNNLDAGVYQRLALACALLNSPKLLILDELIKDIDLYSRYLIIQAIQEFLARGGACINGYSNMEFSEYMNQVGWLENGRVSIIEPQQARDKWDRLLKNFSQPSGDTNG